MIEPAQANLYDPIRFGLNRRSKGRRKKEKYGPIRAQIWLRFNPKKSEKK